MKTKIISIFTILAILLNLMPITSVFASGTSFTLNITADKTTANAGDTITYTITANATGGITVLDFYLDIPDGLTYVAGSGTVGSGVGSIAEKGFTENDLGGIYTFANDSAFELNNVQLGTFKCKVNENSSGNFIVGVKDFEVVDEDWEEISSSNITKNYPTVKVTLNATGVSLDKTSASLNVGEETTLVAILSPGGTTDEVKEWSSSNTSVATVNNGVVKAVSEGTATITVKTTNDKIDTCTIIVTCAHTNKTEVAAKDATCTEEGNNKYYTCDDCGKIFKADGTTETTIENEKIAALGHDFSDENHDDTYHWKVCTRCGEISNKEEHSGDDWKTDETNHWKECGCGIIIEKATHTAGKTIRENEVPATCKVAGSHDEVTKCSVCGKELSREHKVDPTIAHTPGETVKENEVPATHTTTGKYDEVVYCSVCGTEISRVEKTIDIIPHDGTDKPWESDETNHWKTCGCGVKIEEAAHTPAEKVNENIVAPKCTEVGKHDEVVYCSVCHYEISRTKDVVDVATGHNAGEIVKENEVVATCTKDGSYDEVVYCTVCGDELSREIKTIDKLGHKAGTAVKEKEVAATCTKDGSYDEVVYCTVCGDELSRETKTIEKLGHNAGEAVKENEVPATCTTEGSYDEVVYCTRDKEELSRTHKTIAKLSHTPAEAVKENEIKSTVDTEGSYEEVVYCKDCGAELSRESKTTPKFVYEVLEGQNGEHQDETDGTLTFRVNGEFSKFTGLKIDDKEVDKSKYTAKSGSTIVTLAADYLNSLSIGTHKIAFVYDDGEVTTNFKVAEVTTPATNESTNTEADTTTDTAYTTDTTSNDSTNTSATNETKIKTKNSTSVNTGDNSNMTLWIVGLAVSGILFVIVLKCIGKNQKRKH